MVNASKQRVLVLDDDRDFCDLLQAFLESATGAACVIAHSLTELILQGDEALACDLAILDVNLGPGVPSGIDVLEWLRANEFAGRIVFLTGHARWHPRLGAEAATAGLQILEKPVDTGTLVALVGRRDVVTPAAP